jgi:hypothetical protein
MGKEIRQMRKEAKPIAQEIALNNKNTECGN